MDKLLEKLEEKMEEVIKLRSQLKGAERRIAELEAHLGERNQEKIWASTNVILSKDY